MENLDSLDLKIISHLVEDSRMSVTELAKKTKSSRPTVTARLKQLIDNGALISQSGLNLIKAGYKIATASFEVIDDKNRFEFEKKLRACPRILTSYRTSSKANFQATIWGEDEQTIKSTIESFRDFPGVSIIEIDYLGTPIAGKVIISPPRPEDKETPCGKICSDCHSYQNSWCTGCPVSLDYKNPYAR